MEQLHKSYNGGGTLVDKSDRIFEGYEHMEELLDNDTYEDSTYYGGLSFGKSFNQLLQEKIRISIIVAMVFVVMLIVLVIAFVTCTMKEEYLSHH